MHEVFATGRLKSTFNQSYPLLNYNIMTLNIIKLINDTFESLIRYFHTKESKHEHRIPKKKLNIKDTEYMFILIPVK